MEEVDNIIIHSLRQIGCNIEEDVTNLGRFNTELVVEATVRCLDIIRPGLGISTIVPANMAARFRLGATLAQACSELGYRGDIGYQTFLYSSEVDLRRLLMFLIEKLPKESDKSLNEPTSRIALLERQISGAVSSDLSLPWLPHYCHKRGVRNKGCTDRRYRSVDLDISTQGHGDDFQDYRVHYQKPITDQVPDDQYLVPSLVSHNAKLIHESATNIIERLQWLDMHKLSNETVEDKVYSKNDVQSRFTLNQRLQFSQYHFVSQNTQSEEKIPVTQAHTETVTSLSREERRELKIDQVKSECESLRSNLDELQVNVKQLSSKLSQVDVTLRNAEKEVKDSEERRKIKARTYDLLPNGEENIKKLEALVEASANKLINLATQWERHRRPLVEKYRDERAKYSTKAQSTSRKKLDEIKLLREKEKELIEESRNKDQQCTQLLAEIPKLPKESNRSAYTQRILEIINNVRKQRCEIDKVLADTREIQKDINTLTGRLERSFTVADELIFKDAKSNEASRKAYKLLATLHSDCAELVTLVEEIGATVREIRDLEEQIDSESAKNVGANLERITADLKQMKQETATLMAQLQSKNS
ncbi:coiled-coil domain-containing protein 22 homolog isoform X1 [Neodiprion lecontei]|uniref:Coiled-coil domain-containing protein 22 homolog n=1 Tax=Neodiprion lecontei TaxID=441921 RepID=A0ABM3GEB1_NEOLC|nr:coiled-coil domain-containing protein 22 homolog isoform X1 [Neodiprion lecontei]